MTVSVCSGCITGDILPGEPTGSFPEGYFGAYLSPAPPGSTNYRAIVLLTDLFGLPLKNSKIIADWFASDLRCDVWVPDLFAGKPPFRPEQAVLPGRAGQSLGFFGILKLIFTIVPAIPGLISNRPSVCDQRVENFLSKLKADNKYDKLGAIGYCFGGVIAINLGSKDFVHTLVVCHPGRCSMEQIKAIKLPTSWVVAEDDAIFGKKKRDDAEAIFAARKDKPDFIDYEFKDYKGTVHGFAARAKQDIPEVKEAQRLAFQQSVDWFNKTIP